MRNEQTNDLQQVRRVLGFAAMGVMVSASVANSAQETVAVVQENLEDAQSIQSLVKAVGALTRGFMPDVKLCRQGQREAHHLILALQDRGVQIDVPRPR